MPEDSRVTLQDIADHLGLSRPTVSMAMRGTGRISQATKKRVRQAAEELGYRPDPLMSAFSRHRQKGASPGSVIALIGTETHDLEAWLQPAVSTAARLGYRLEPFSWEDYRTQPALFHVLESRGVAGVIFIEQRQAPVLELPLWQNLRGVQCGPYPSGNDGDCPFPIVRGNPFDAVCVAWEKGLAAGCERIGLLLPMKSTIPDAMEKKMLGGYGFCQEHSQRTLPKLSPRILSTTEVRLAKAQEETSRWLREQAPDLVITGSLLGYDHLRESGAKIPEDFALINLRQSAFRTETAGCILDRVAVINTAICHLHTIIQHGPEMQAVHQTTIVLNPIWQDGDSFPATGDHRAVP